ncbi:MAG: hypothetical protein MR051_03500, partial [Lentisphaeria bacterium]|nr:hypothetical protein [Lentisphaeria bacterium]
MSYKYYASSDHSELNTVTVAGHEFTGLDYQGDTLPADITPVDALADTVIYGVNLSDQVTFTGAAAKGDFAVKDAAWDFSTVASGYGFDWNIGGGVASYFENVAFTNKSSGNSAVRNSDSTMYLTDVTFADNRISGLGGALYSKGTSWIDGGVFSNNAATGSHGGAIFATKGTLNVSGTTFADNTAANGGAVKVDGTADANANIADALFVGNVSTGLGGALSMDGLTTTVTGSTFTGNSAVTGGAIYMNAGTMSISGSTIAGNIVNNSGGAIGIVGGSLTVAGTVVSGNSSTSTDTSYGGGAISVSGGMLNIATGTVITGNSAGSYGGAIRVSSGNLTMDGATVSASGTARFGGALYLQQYAGTVELNNSLFQNNNGNSHGGAVMSQSASGFSVSGSTFAANRATSGGAIFSDRGANAVTNGKFFDNTASNGGAAYIDGSTLTLSGGTFAGNSAATFGGAVYVKGANAELAVSGVTFSGNSAGSHGGAMFFASAKSVSLSNVVFDGNIAANSGAFHTDVDVTVSDSAFLTASDVIGFGSDRVITFSGTNRLNARITGTGTVLMSDNAALVFGNSSDISISAAVAFGADGDDADEVA